MADKIEVNQKVTLPNTGKLWLGFEGEGVADLSPAPSSTLGRAVADPMPAGGYEKELSASISCASAFGLLMQ